MASQLNEFLEEGQVKAHGTNWEAKKKDWIDAVRILFVQIETMMSQSLTNGGVRLTRVPVEITEDFVGTFTIEELRLSVGDDLVVFVPIGMTVIGATGRVDVRGGRDRLSLLWSGGMEWQVVLDRLPKPILVPLDEEALVEVLRRVMTP